MQKPNSYDQVQALGEFTPIKAGGHKLKIMQVVEMTSKTGKPMLRVSFDTADNDVQPNYFSDLYKRDTRQDRKWPNNGITYIMVEDFNGGDCSRAFKTFITSVEKSNTGFTTQWGETFASQFRNRLVGGVFGIQHDAYNGKETHRTNLRWFREIAEIEKAAIPDETETEAYKALKNSTPSAGTDGFMHIPDGVDEELPFN